MIDEKAYNGVLFIYRGKITMKGKIISVFSCVGYLGWVYAEVADNLIGMGLGGPMGWETTVGAVICAGVNRE
ncbi:MAG: hypothetical protein LBL06_05290 [Treponema sp.]|jgi:hypothetical protein|nr:hypothetical protein [Treponema sp.]